MEMFGLFVCLFVCLFGAYVAHVKLNMSFFHNQYRNENDWNSYVRCVQHTVKRGAFYKTSGRGISMTFVLMLSKEKRTRDVRYHIGPIVSPNLNYKHYFHIPLKNAI